MMIHAHIRLLNRYHTNMKYGILHIRLLFQIF